MSKVVIRKAGPSDWREYKELMLLRLKQNPECFENTIEEEMEYNDSIWQGYVSGEVSTAFVAIIDGKMVANVAILTKDIDPEEHLVKGAVVGIIVDKNYIGQALAQRLFDHIIEYSIMNNYKKIELKVISDNEAAINLYQKVGFKKTNQSGKYILFELKLPKIDTVVFDLSGVCFVGSGKGPLEETSTEVIQETLEKIKNYKQQGKNLYYLTNSANSHVFKARADSDLIKRFVGGHSSQDSKYKKPQVELFQEFINKYKIDPKSVLYYDDKQKNINTAKEVGFRTILYQPLNNN